MWLVIITIVIAFLLVLYLCVLKKDGTEKENFRVEREKVRSNFIPTNPKGAFVVYNYLPNHSLKIDVIDPQGHTKTIVSNLPPTKSVTIPKETIDQFFTSGSTIHFFTFTPSVLASMKSYTRVIIDTPENYRAKALHVGMVTTRFIGATDQFRDVTHVANAVQGQPYVTIHNLTERPITLNGHINVPPHSEIRYAGQRDKHQGVALGTWFTDDDKMYPTFQYLQPHSDLYYGVVSDLQQPLQGDWQMGFSDSVDASQTLWPFQLGQY